MARNWVGMKDLGKAVGKKKRREFVLLYKCKESPSSSEQEVLSIETVSVGLWPVALWRLRHTA